MYKRKIFKKKKISFIFYYMIILILIFISCYFFLKKKPYFIIPFHKDPYYVIPKEKGGKQIANQDKRGLHLSYKNNNDFNISNNIDLKYSIQLLTHDDYSYIRKKRDEFLNKKDTIYLSSELFISFLKNNFGNEYMLLYKNFNTRNEAVEHCKKYAYFVNKCRIVNVQNLD